MNMQTNDQATVQPSPVSPAARQTVVIGGVAGGASAAARLRRLDEHGRIIVLERGADVSFANCGLPYHVGGEIEDRSKLALQTPASLRALLNLDVRVRHEALSIDRVGRTVRVRNLTSEEEFNLSYDKLILAPGASPFRPTWPGMEDKRIVTLRNLEDMDRIVQLARAARRTAVVGAGFIGLEMAEQLRRLGKEVTVIELRPQVLPPLDPEMAAAVQTELIRNGVILRLGEGPHGFEPGADSVTIRMTSGEGLEADLVVFSIGVRPETGLARAAGLTLGERGHIVVNDFMQTNDPDIYAVGDAVETIEAMTGLSISVPLGGPANRQGRVAAEHIANPDQALPYPGSLGTSIVRVFELAAGMTGLSETRLRSLGRPFRRCVVSDFHHAGYYPGAVPVTVKILWEPGSGRLLGGQVYGTQGVDKRLDVLSTALRGKLTIDDLEHLELTYAPPFGAAKDPVNIAGFLARNIESGYVEVTAGWPDDPNAQIIDTRPPQFQKEKPLRGIRHLPIGELRQRLDELDPSRPVWTICKTGKTSYFAARLLTQRGFTAKCIDGGILLNQHGPHLNFV